MHDKKFCNMCGKELDMWDLQENYSIHKTCGYGSTHDMDEVDMRLCCRCFDDLVDRCKICPVVEDEILENYYEEAEWKILR